MPEIGWAGLGIVPEVGADFGRKLGRDVDPALSRVAHDSGKRFGGIFGKVAAGAAVGLLGAGVAAVELGKDAIAAASDLEESTNKVSQVFGKGADEIFRFSSKAADALGQTNQQARDAAATFGIFGKAADLTDRQNAKFAKSMTKLASDLASFHNTSPEQAIEAIGAALRGESEPIRSYGVLLDEATLKAEALRLGLLKPVKDQAKIQSYHVALIEGQKKYNAAVKEFGPNSLEALKAEASLDTSRARLVKATEGTIPPLTQQQKVLAAQSEIFKQTKVAQGDFARTSDGLANQQRRMTARFEDAKAALGKGLLPIMTDVSEFILDEGLPAFEDFSDWFGEKGAPAISDFADDMKPLAKEILPAAGDALGVMVEALKTAAPYAKDLVEAFNGLPDWAKTGVVLGGAGLAVKSKLGKAGDGLLGSSKGGTLTDPAFVYVVNGGTNVGGKGGKPGGGFLGGFGGASALLATLGAQVVIDNGPKIASGLKGPDQAADASVAAIQRALEKSDIGKYADDIGINIEALATGIAAQGEQSKEFQDAVKKLQKTNSGAWEDINDLIPVVGTWITTSGDHAAWALKDLRSIVEGASREVRNQHNLDMLDALKANDKPGSAFANAFGLPDKKGKGGKSTLDAEMTLLFTPEAKETKAGVAKLLEDVGDLDRRPYDLKFNALGLRTAKNDAQILLETLLKISNQTRSIGGPSGLNPFDGPSRTNTPRRDLNIERLVVSGTTSQQLSRDLQDIQRRASIGGFG